MASIILASATAFPMARSERLQPAAELRQPRRPPDEQQQRLSLDHRHGHADRESRQQLMLKLRELRNLPVCATELPT